MNKCALLFMLLSILPASARMIAQDNEVYELKTKLEYAKDLAALHPDPGHVWATKRILTDKLLQLAQKESQLPAIQTTDESEVKPTASGFGFNSNPTRTRATRGSRAIVASPPSTGFGASTGFGSPQAQPYPNETPEQKLDRESHLREVYSIERMDLEKQISDLEKIPENRRLHDLTKNNLERSKEAYGKALMNYFELE